jgi:hypothetical protein
MARSFRISDSDANELVQEMYVRICKYVDDHDRIMYNPAELNTYYIYVTLRNLYLSSFHKDKRINHYSIDDALHMDDFIDLNYKCMNLENQIEFNNLVKEIQTEVLEWYWYDKKIWDIHFNSQMSMRKISRETNISLSSIFNTLSNGKKKIRDKTQEQYKKYKETED